MCQYKLSSFPYSDPIFMDDKDAALVALRLTGDGAILIDTFGIDTWFNIKNEIFKSNETNVIMYMTAKSIFSKMDWGTFSIS